jgi:sulfur-carrier protein
MIVKVRLFANLRDYVPETKNGSTIEVDVQSGASLKDLANQLKLPLNLVKLAYVNGIYQEMDYQLNQNDEIGIFPPIGGG